MSGLVSAEQLQQSIADPHLVVADVRWYLQDKKGRDAYAAGHIPGAFFVDVETELSTPPELREPGQGRHPLPSIEVVAALLSRLGVTGASRVVAYDDAGGAIAARMWWVLRYFGLDVVSLLDGGIQAWEAAGGALSADQPAEKGTTVGPLTPHRELVVTADDVDALRQRRDALLLDARMRDRYTGWEEPIDARAGHIPGAVSAPFTGNLESGRFRDPEALRRRFDELGALERPTVIAYCGSGVTACHHLYALALAGRDDARLYAGSWSEWAADPNRPVATGDE